MTVLDTMYKECKGPGLTKTKDIMLSLLPDDVDMLSDVLSTVNEWSYVLSASDKRVAYVPTSTCIHFMIITLSDKQSSHTRCHQHKYTNRYFVLKGTKDSVDLTALLRHQQLALVQSTRGWIGHITHIHTCHGSLQCSCLVTVLCCPRTGGTA